MPSQTEVRTIVCGHQHARRHSVLTRPQHRSLVPDVLTGAQYLVTNPGRRDLALPLSEHLPGSERRERVSP